AGIATLFQGLADAARRKKIRQAALCELISAYLVSRQDTNLIIPLPEANEKSYQQESRCCQSAFWHSRFP
ncbi:MAG: hypothetical protein E6X17_13465, partial [Sporomusaceae bacterium]|nr:hypothetical protein [Sporomusaceae bacterium]